MAITYAYGRIVIQQGMSVGLTFGFVNADLITYANFSDWTATFEIFNADGLSLFKWDSTASAIVSTGLWTGDGVVVPDESFEGFAYNVYVELPKELTKTMTDWGIGHFDLDVLDPFGHAQYRVHDEIVLEEGTTHG